MSTSCNYSQKYAPLLRLLECQHEDRAFLETHAGYSEDLGREYDSLRRAAILAYVRALEQDWKTLYEEVRPYALQDVQIAEMLSSVETRLQRVTRRIKLQIKVERWTRMPSRRIKMAAVLLQEMSEIRRLSGSALAIR
jgi:hypothetical protein